MLRTYLVDGQPVTVAWAHRQHLPVSTIRVGGTPAAGSVERTALARWLTVDDHRRPLGAQRPLGVKGGGDSSKRRRKRRLHRIARGLEVDATMCLDGRIEQGDVVLDCDRHRCPVPFPQRRAALDVGEEESDRPRRQLGHAAISGRF
jgi:hypothetical protein